MDIVAKIHALNQGHKAIGSVLVSPYYDLTIYPLEDIEAFGCSIAAEYQTSGLWVAWFRITGCRSITEALLKRLQYHAKYNNIKPE